VIEAVRLITPTVELQKFWRKVHRIGSMAVGFKDTAALRHPPVIEDDENREQVTQHLGVSNLIVEEGELSYAHYTRRVLPHENLKRELFRVLERFSGADDGEDSLDPNRPENRLRDSLDRIGRNYGVANQRELRLPVVDIKPVSSELGTEYFLTTDEKSTDMLHEMDRAIYDAVRSTGPGAALCRTSRFVEANGVLFAGLPADIDPQRQNSFERWITSCISDEGLVLLAGPVDWRYGPAR
jgi:hypothetical protein